MDKVRTLRILEAASVLTFFLQALRVIFSVMFGVIYDQVFEGPMTPWFLISNLLVILALLAPAAMPRASGRKWLAATAILAGIGRIPLSINIADVRYWSALVVLIAAELYLSCLLARNRSAALAGLLAALVLDQVLRAAGHTYDITLRQSWLIVQVFWGILVLLAALWLARKEGISRPAPAPGWLWGLGLGGFLFLETSLLALPNAAARWSDGSYTLLAPVLLAITWLPLIRPVRRFLAVICRRPWALFLLAGILEAALLAGYFLSGPVAIGMLAAGQAAALAGLVCLLDGDPGGNRSTGVSLGLGMVFFLLLNFFNAFAFTYPYTLPFMRGMGWVVYLVAGLVIWAAVLGVSAWHRIPQKELPGGVWIWAAAVLSFALVVIFAWPRGSTSEVSDDLRIATYNIHYGYDDSWHFTLDDIARTIKENEVDVIALQEVDTGRLTSYSVDDAYYLAWRLGMHAIYLPTVEHLTGIALLARGQVQDSGGAWVTSSREQTGFAFVKVQAGNQPVDVYGTWLGLSGENTERQIEEVLAKIGEHSPVALGGDFNAEPDSPVVTAVRDAGFKDPFTSLGVEPPPTDPAIHPVKRIDYVWLRGFRPVNAWVLESTASDHRTVVVEAIPQK